MQFAESELHKTLRDIIRVYLHQSMRVNYVSLSIFDNIIRNRNRKEAKFGCLFKLNVNFN